MHVGEVTEIEQQKRIYTTYYKDDNTEMGTKQIKMYLHKDEMKKVSGWYKDYKEAKFGVLWQY